MEQDEDTLIGEPVEEVPQREPDEDCNARRTDDGRFLGYCNRTAGWGTDSDDGRCRTHGGSDDSGAPEGNTNAEDNDGGAPENNTNAVTHALFVQSNKFYQQVIGDGLRELCDDIYDDYVEKFRELNGEPVAGEKARLSEIAINHIKIIHGDNWAVERPESLDTGNALVDEETRKKASQHEVHTEKRYTETPVVKIQQRLRKEDRKWLKEYGLLGADAIDVNVDGQVEHEHGLDEDTKELVAELAEDLKA